MPEAFQDCAVAHTERHGMRRGHGQEPRGQMGERWERKTEQKMRKTNGRHILNQGRLVIQNENNSQEQLSFFAFFLLWSNMPVYLKWERLNGSLWNQTYWRGFVCAGRASPRERYWSWRTWAWTRKIGATESKEKNNLKRSPPPPPRHTVRPQSLQGNKIWNQQLIWPLF